MNFFNDIIDFNFELDKNIGFCNLTDEYFCLILNKINFRLSRNILLVVDSLYEANKIYNSLSCYNSNVFLFPMDDFLTSEALAISPDLMLNRLETLNNLNNCRPAIVVTNLMGYLRFLPNKKTYDSFFMELSVGKVISPNEIVNYLISAGYTRDTIVNKTGEYGVRGYILDVFIIDEENPIRIEFFDDEIESIRYFDTETQKSIKNLNSIIIKPFHEFLSQKVVSEEHFRKQKYLSYYDDICNISSYLDNCLTFFKDYNQLEVSYKNIINEVLEYKKEKDSSFSGKYFFDFYDLVPNYACYYFSLNNIDINYNLYKFYSFDIKSINNFSEDSDSINSFIRKCISNDMTVILVLKKMNIRSVMKNLNMKIYNSSFDNIILNNVNVIEGEMNCGFIYKKYVVLTSNELFKSNDVKKKYSIKYKYSTSINDINKLSIGDYVVHNVHGIGVYNGIKTLTLSGVSKDYLEVLYQGADKIYIPVEKIDLLGRFSGNEGIVPKINKLGGSEWKKTKSRVRSKVADIAQKLIKLYAEREARKGFCFSKDCEMSIDFENDFPYDLTTDQKKAIVQIKADMESSVPMDRLLCGDVGFGKTEVAFVAAFKAILDSKQVLFLCPTTILSNQHYENAKIRFKNFPVNIALLNRFTSTKEVSRIIEGLKDGTIDIVFGTHRLLSNDVIPKNLGLLIIDEEQRFGVTHKEKIKEYKTNIDVLTLTATPIPRTLQMSLVGIRSLSLIETPPVNRYPVQTYVVEENNQIIKDSIYKELSRKGQIFILYNRVQHIEEFALKISKLIPEARLAIAHGQMSKNELEDTIYRFINYEYDILVCTTIIETGIDIPNVNTLIIIDADRFGLSQLYQIRGRVGRSDKFAYAYLMYQPFKSLSENAVKRLNVIKEFTELGSGFSIATRDLSIRGAGDILGSEQAGFIDSVGIDLYLKFLNDEINKINCDNINIDDSEDNIDNYKPLINVTTHIDDNYVMDDDLKIEIHRKINSIDDEESFNFVREELEDRFGKISDNLLVYMYEEWFEKLAKKINVSHVNQTKNSIELVFSKDVISNFDTEKLFIDAYHISNMFRFVSRGTNLVIVLDTIRLDKHPVYYLVSLLTKINSNFY